MNYFSQYEWKSREKSLITDKFNSTNFLSNFLIVNTSALKWVKKGTLGGDKKLANAFASCD